MANKKTSIWQNFLTPVKFLLRQSAWDDLRFPATAINPPGTVDDPSFDTTDVGFTFATGSTNILYIIGQLPHKRTPHTSIVPHVHWRQEQSGTPKWQLEYKWIANGENVPTTFTTITTTENVFTYTSGSIMQISTFGEIADPFDGEPNSYGLSSLIHMKLSRLGGDAEDTYEADLLLSEFDIHFQIDTLGSFKEFVKYG